MFIYLITNKVNGKQYVGQTIQSIEKRWKFHCSRHSRCLAIKSAIDKYGKDNFVIESIYIATSLEELNKKEEEYIKQYNTLTPNGYNLMTGGDRTVFSEESRRKMSVAHQGKPGPMVGKKHSDETKLKLSIIGKGRAPWNKGLTKEDPRVASYVKYGIDNGAYGNGHHNKPHSEESKRKMSESKKGTVWSEETRKTMSQSEKRNKQKIPILCVETGKKYEAVSYAAKDLGLNSGAIHNVITGARKTAGGYTFMKVSS